MIKKLMCGMLTSVILTTGALSVSAESPIAVYDSWSEDLKSYTMQVSDEYGVDYSLVLGVIYNESRFKSGLTHVNSNGTTDYGLMQVNEVNFDYLHKTLGIKSMKELLNDKTGIRCGIQLLAYHKQAAGSDSAALLRYQIGAGKYNQYLSNGRTTNKTHQQVLEYQNIYQEYLASQKQESKLSEFTKRNSLESILNMWAEMLT